MSWSLYGSKGGNVLNRIKLLPLIVLVWCAGVSLSSGLYYYDISSILYLFPVGLITIMYYVLYMLFGDVKRKELICFGGVAGLSALSFLVLRKTIIPGFILLYNTVSYRLFIAYDLNLGQWRVEDEGSVALAVSQLVALVMAVSLYLYETHRPAAVTALPSFLLFIVSVAADGVPYEVCTIVYGGTLIIFLGMGRRGESLPKFLLLFSCTAVTALVVGLGCSWKDVSRHMWEYRNQITKASSNSGTEGESDSAGKDQMIDFGQFSKQGDITYNGTVELHVVPKEPCSGTQLLLRGYTAEYYGGNQWSGTWTGSDWKDDIWKGIIDEAFPPDMDMEIENAFDKGSYIPYIVRPESYEEWEKVRTVSDSFISEAVEDEVGRGLRKRILKEIIRGQKYKTIGDAVNIVKTHFGEGFQYTLHPGELEDGTDEVERFLFTRKTGYCTHFASAAVMIFRSMGIPARIAEGYMVNGDRLQPGEPTDVFDYNAHAWTEIWIESDAGMGWMPLDVTSYVLGNMQGENPIGAERGDIARRPQQDGQKEKQEKKEKEEENEKERKKPDRKPGENKDGVWKQVRDAAGKFASENMTWKAGLILSGSAAAAGGLSALAVCLWRRRRRRKVREQMRQGSFKTRILFVNDSLDGFWREAGVPWDYSDSVLQTENIFQKTGKYFSSFSGREYRERIYQYVRTVYESRFGAGDMDEEMYGANMAYLSELFAMIKKNTDKKKWKKFLRCNVVKIFDEYGGLV